MQGRIEIFTKSSIRDTEGEKLSSKIKNELNIDLKCHFIECYNFSDEINKNELEEIAKIVFLDKIATDFAVKEPAFASLIRIEERVLQL
jgi:phosphoribosylformylglycinamidine (FGAM) synthase PurS component